MKNKMNRRKNDKLFWMGFSANLKRFIGILIILFGVLILFFNGIIGIILMGIGFYLTYKGSSQKFHFQRESGYIIHRGH
ncbi:MAG: hypothetical protein Q8N63_03530 [Nanoarchaeota archaeon]|nr:hypothetical protein [Nanoarchaeota archaeon]